MIAVSLGSNTFSDAELIFAGRRSSIYRARRRADGRPVVLKVLPGPYPPARQIERLKREFAITSALDVEGVVEALDLVELGESLGMVLADTGGEPLTRRLEKGPLPTEMVLKLGRDLARTLHEVHARNVIHKDVNPSNVLWNGEQDRLQLIDFGIATNLSRERPDALSVSDLEGTLAYMSPEQTGRTNRAIDYRTDLYSLGVTLYEMLSGSRPFDSDDPLDLLHCHLAQEPTAPHVVNPGVPDVVSAIVMKLLSKDAEDRYQSAAGVAADLDRCLASRTADGRIGAFAIAEDDRASALEVPQKLYGRGADVARLEEAFDRCATGGFEIALVVGAPGIGKSALVRSLHRRVSQRRGTFAAGKFGQYQRDRPYQSVLEALRFFVRQILAESEERLAAWRSRLQEAMGVTGQAALDVIPDLERLVGPQPPLTELPPADAEHRFHTAIRRIVAALSSPDAPLVLFLDDLQWADAASLRLLEQLATDPQAGHLLVVGAYRDKEVDASHPTSLCLDAIRRAGVTVTTHRLGRLALPSVRELLVDTLRRDDEEVSALAEICLEKTAGNPFFLRQFLQRLVDDELLTWSSSGRRWVWSANRIAEAAYTDNVVDFLTEQARALPTEERDLLRLGAVLGPTFDWDTLACFEIDTGPVDTGPSADAAVIRCVRLGLLIPLGRRRSEAGSARFSFTHDRVQQAAYALTPPAELPSLHLAVGRALLANLDEGDRSQLFEVVAHLNRALERMDDPSERRRLAELNLLAGRRALRSAAAQEALAFLERGIEALGDEGWQRHHPLSLELHETACEAALLAGRSERMDELAAAVMDHARGLFDSLRVKQLAIAQRKSDRDLNGAVEGSLDLLGELGVDLVRSKNDAVVLRELLKTKLRLRGKSMHDLERLPPMQDRTREAAMGVLGNLLPAAYYARPELLPFITFELVRMSVEHGVTPTSAYGFAVYGLLLCTLGQIDAGYDVGAMATRLGERLGDPRFANLARHLFQAHIRFWKEPLRRCMDVEREVHRMGVEVGDYEYAAFGAMMHCNMSVFVGDPLGDVLDTHRTYGAAIRRLQQETSVNQHAITMQMVMNLIGESKGRHRLQGPVYDEEQMQPLHEREGDATMLFVHHAVKVALSVIFDEPREGLEHVRALSTYAQAAASSLWSFIADYYAALCELMAWPSTSFKGRGQLLVSVARRRLRLAKWAKSCPENFGHKLALIDAEIARIRGLEPEAMRHYARAFEQAREQGFTGEEALACERASRFYAGLDQDVAARAHLARARYAYGRWGAIAKVTDLDAELAPHFATGEGGILSTATTTFHTSVQATGDQIDLAAVLNAAQAISEPLILRELLERLMRTIVSNAGAQRGLLVLTRRGKPYVEATLEEDGEVAVGPSVPLESFPEASRAVVSYVLRMAESVVVADARSAAEFRHDPYLSSGAVRSVLCAPLMKQGRATAAIYLENNLSADAFTPARAKIVTMLASQAAISMENARLYSELDEKVKERTAQLEIRNRFIREVFGRYLSDNIVDNLLKTPEGLALGGETRVVTVLMADLRGFIAKTTGLEPHRVVQLINVFLSAMTEVIIRHGGTIDEFIGDAILVVFGAPVLREDDADRAVICALQMQREMAAVNEKNRALDLPEVAMGIGLCTGEVVVGNIGSERRAKYGVVGAPVNLASRIESFTRGGDILIPESTRRSVSAPLITDRELEVTTKGQPDAMRLYSLIGIEGRPELDLHRDARQVVELEDAIPIRYHVIDDNRERPMAREAAIVAMSQSEALLRGDRDEPAFTNLRLILPERDDAAPPIYGKVEPRNGEPEGHFTVCFTAVPPAAQEVLTRYLPAGMGTEGET